MGSYTRALELYEEIHEDYPNNLECLRYLVAICKDLGHHYDHYQKKLSKLERANAAKTQTMGGAGALTRIGGGMGPADGGAQQAPVRSFKPTNQEAVADTGSTEPPPSNMAAP